jgi:hypothetical protein
VSRRAVDDVWRRGVLPLVLVTSGFEALHASAVATSRGVIAFGAGSGTGKSTIACALRNRGFRHWADDAVVFQPSGGGITAVPLPFAVRLDEASRAYAGAAPAADEIDEADEAPLAAICVLSRLAADSGDPVRIARLTGAHALTAVLPHAHVFDPNDRGRNRVMVEDYLLLVECVPVYAVAFQPGREAWPAVLDALANRFAE